MESHHPSPTHCLWSTLQFDKSEVGSLKPPPLPRGLGLGVGPLGGLVVVAILVGMPEKFGNTARDGLMDPDESLGGMACGLPVPDEKTVGPPVATVGVVIGSSTMLGGHVKHVGIAVLAAGEILKTGLKGSEGEPPGDAVGLSVPSKKGTEEVLVGR